MKKKSSAFSLIELSIVVVMIGILIAGVLRSSRVAYEGRLQAARGVTRGGPVPSIKGLLLWLEPTLDESFMFFKPEEGDQITVWKDTNPQNPYNFYAIKYATDGATYSEKGMNGLPAVKLSGADGDSPFRLSNQSNPAVGVNVALDSPRSEYTFFLVTKTKALPSVNGYLFVNGYSENDSIAYYITSGGVRTTAHKESTPETIAASGTDDLHVAITTGTYSVDVGGSTGTANLYVNGSNVSTSAVTDLLEVAGDKEFTIGAKRHSVPDTEYWDGLIAEFIYYDHKLSDKKREEVEKYLGKKYYVTVNH